MQWEITWVNQTKLSSNYKSALCETKQSFWATYDTYKFSLQSDAVANTTDGNQLTFPSVTSSQKRLGMRNKCDAWNFTSGSRPWIKNVCCLSSLISFIRPKADNKFQPSPNTFSLSSELQIISYHICSLCSRDQLVA